MSELPYRQLFKLSDGWYWGWIDSYGDPSGEAHGPFETRPDAVSDATGGPLEEKVSGDA